MPYKIKIISLILCTVSISFAIEVEFHLYPGWNLISMPCSTDVVHIDSLLPIVPPAFEFVPGTGYVILDSIPAPNVGFWVLSIVETTFAIECECIDVREEYMHRATLEHQTKHSGIGVESIGAFFVMTDSNGHYELPPLDDGTYSVNFFFPYYRNERRTITVSGGEIIDTLEDIELKQILDLSLQLNDSVFYNGDSIIFTLQTTNISDSIFEMTWLDIPDMRMIFCETCSSFMCLPIIFAEQTTFLLYPGDYLLFSDRRVIGESLLSPTYSGECSSVYGVRLLDIGSAYIYIRFETYFPACMAEFVYNKLPRKRFLVNP